MKVHNELMAVGSIFFFFNRANLKRVKPFRRRKPKIGRNDHCGCGSGKKSKYCCKKE
jgi:uncharacterized protein YchJ